ncbi:MAG: hypothetical protein AAFU71_04275 [Cyanobacteria bacterium J06632_22]
MGFRLSATIAATFGGIALLSSLPGAISPAPAQTCAPLEVVGGEGTEVTKLVSPIGTFIFINTNWDTDFAVPGNTNYTSFVVTMLPEDGEVYDIDVYYKYSDGTADQVYSVPGAVLTEGEALIISEPDRVNDNPFQVNVRVGGAASEGNRYTISVQGCR